MQIRRLSPQILNDVTNAVHQALKLDNIVNVPLIAEEVRRKNESENVALEDIELCALHVTNALRGAVLFDGRRFLAGHSAEAVATNPMLRQ